MATFGTFVDGTSLKASELNDLFRQKSDASGTPVYQSGIVTQGAGSLRYFTVAKFVIGFFYASISGAGTAGNRIEAALPVTAASSSVRVIGSGLFRDNSPLGFRAIRVVQYSTTRMAFLTDTATSLTSYLGTTNGPAVTLANNDQLFGSFIYEAA
mgnify:CR=1 FL=1